MAGRALTQEAMLAGLRDIRLPGDAPGGLLAEGLAALALGLLLAVMLGGALRLVTQARPRGAQAEPDDIATLPEEDQRLLLLKRLKARAPERYAALTQTLYQRGGLPDIALLRAEVQRHD